MPNIYLMQNRDTATAARSGLPDVDTKYLLITEYTHSDRGTQPHRIMRFTAARGEWQGECMGECTAKTLVSADLDRMGEHAAGSSAGRTSAFRTAHRARIGSSPLLIVRRIVAASGTGWEVESTSAHAE